MNDRQNLIDKIKSMGLPSANSPCPVVSLDEFFISNTDEGSIGCNLLPPIPMEVFYKVLRGIRDRNDVQHVLVEIREVDETYADIWPFSDLIYIITSAEKQEVARWIGELRADELEEGYPWRDPPAYFPAVEKGMRVYRVWWD